MKKSFLEFQLIVSCGLYGIGGLIFFFLLLPLHFFPPALAVVPSTQTYYYPNGYEVKETPAGRETSRYIPVGPVTVLEKGNKTYYLHPDQVASTALITDQQGNKVQEPAYYPYGKEFKSQAPKPNNPTDRLYTSQIKDRTHLYFYNARYYNPRTASFISADYANDQANRGNRYLYVGGSPIARNDPEGRRLMEGAGAWGGSRRKLIILSDSVLGFSGGRIKESGRTYADPSYPRFLSVVDRLKANQTLSENFAISPFIAPGQTSRFAVKKSREIAAKMEIDSQSVVVINYGYNDLNGRATAADYYANMQKTVAALGPARIILMGVYPPREKEKGKINYDPDKLAAMFIILLIRAIVRLMPTTNIRIQPEPISWRE